MGIVLDTAERMWNGDTSGYNVHAAATMVEIEPIDEGLAFMAAFSNVLVVNTEEGLVLLDTSSFFHAATVHQKVRGWTPRPVHTAVYTHGHVDHVFGVAPFDAEAEDRGHKKPWVIAHTACPARFDRYRLTNGYNAIINWRQFRLSPEPVFPRHFRYPDETIDREKVLEIGGTRIELFHDKGETDDHLWAWIPEKKSLYTGDLFIWAAPNCGNPQKVQRYPREWALAFRKMDALGAERLFPGHGPPIIGAARVHQALTESAELLEFLVEKTLAMMNDGARLEDILHAVVAPAHLLERPYLRPVYDDPMFIVRNLWRLYGGWYDGNPAHLKPARPEKLAAAIAALAGSPGALAERALAAAAEGELEVAAHLVEFAVRAAPGDAKVNAVRAEIYQERVKRESSLMAKGIFRAAARDSGADT